MLSWSFALAVLALVALPPLGPRALRPALHAALSALGLFLVWQVPLGAVGATCLGVWAAGRLLPRCPPPLRGPLLALAVTAVVAGFVWLKTGAHGVWGQAISPPAGWGGASGGPAAGAIVGLSYFTLKFVQHLVDAAAGRAAHVGLVDFVCCILFLPTFAAGPIERSDTFARQLATLAPSADDRAQGLERIVFGLGKKLLLGDPLLRYALPVFADPGAATPAATLLAVYAYALGLYLDFAAYSDMAIGAGRAAGLRIRENFDRPYLQPDIAALWQHWHMSFTGWLRDFVFLPVTRRTLRASGHALGSQVTGQLVTMTVCGLWHGFAWHFALWGLYHGVGLAGLTLWRRWRGKAPAAAWRRVLATLATFHFFAFGRVLFANALPGTARVFARLLGLGHLLGPG
jgi:alginate O-acetyltransferase complex protein AlgI